MGCSQAAGAAVGCVSVICCIERQLWQSGLPHTCSQPHPGACVLLLCTAAHLAGTGTHAELVQCSLITRLVVPLLVAGHEAGRSTQLLDTRLLDVLNGVFRVSDAHSAMFGATQQSLWTVLCGCCVTAISSSCCQLSCDAVAEQLVDGAPLEQPNTRYLSNQTLLLMLGSLVSCCAVLFDLPVLFGLCLVRCCCRRVPAHPHAAAVCGADQGCHTQHCCQQATQGCADQVCLEAPQSPRGVSLQVCRHRQVHGQLHRLLCAQAAHRVHKARCTTGGGATKACTCLQQTV